MPQQPPFLEVAEMFFGDCRIETADVARGRKDRQLMTGATSLIAKMSERRGMSSRGLNG